MYLKSKKINAHICNLKISNDTRNNIQYIWQLKNVTNNKQIDKIYKKNLVLVQC